MNFKYPISKEDGTDYNAEELYAILSKEKSGHYLLGNHQFWHGGIHFSTETVKQCVLKQPIRCIADGEVIAYRINKIYKSSKLNNTILKYSSSFCLVKHEYESPAEPIKIPEKDPTKLNEDWQNKKIETLATGFSSYSDEAYNNKKLMPKGLKLEILHVNDTTKEIRNTEYYLAKAKVLEAIEANTTNNTGAYNKDEELWFAAFKKDGSLQSSVPQKTDLFKQTDSTDATTEDKKESEETSKSPEAKTNKLTFYSLYMHLLPYDEYPAKKEEIKQQAKIIASNLRARDKIIGDEKAQVIGKISKDTVVNILSVSEDKSGNNYCAKVTIFNNSGKITSINETTKKEEQVTPPADGFWIVLKDKQTNNGEITWREYAKELPVPKREYPKYWAKQVTAKVTASELNVRQAPGADSDVAGEPLGVRLKKDDEVTYDNSKVKSLKINGKAYQMAECKLIKDKAEFTEKGITSFWACIESKFMTVIKAEPDTFDTVDITNMKISAGDPIGYLGLYEVPNSPTGGKSDSPKKQVHIEVFTVASEEELKKFLDNEAGLTIGRQYIKIPKDTVLDKQEAEANGTSDVALNSTWQNKETKTLANNFASYASEGLGATGKKRMPKGLKLKILQVKDTTNKIGKSNYYIAKAKVLEDIKADIAGTNDYKKDEEIWFAAFTADKKITYINNQKTNLFEEDVTPKQDNTVLSPDIQKLQDAYYQTKYEHIVSPDKAKLVKDKYTVTIYENKQSVTGCVAQDKIQKISQYNLTELGFKIIKEENANADGNVTTSKDGFIDQEKMTPFFQDLCKEIDSKENGGDGDGKLSLSELRNALKDPALSEKWSKLIAYHPTEWQAKGDDAKWNRLVTDILSAETDRALLNHEKERITNLVFWDDVPDLKGKKAAFHFHPVAFLEHLYADNTNQRNICKICGKSLKLEPDFLKIIAPDAEEDFINAFSKLSKKLFPKYGIDTCDQIWHLLAQSKVETQLFVKFRENLNYTAKSYTAEKLYSMCKTVIDNGFTRLGMGNLTKEERIDYVGKNLLGNDAAFGAHCYGNDKFPGKDYRGRGLIHLTHFDAYEKCAKAIGYQIDAQPELAETDYHVIVETGLWYWKEHDIAILANNRSVSDNQAVTAVTKKINAGLKNLSDRIKFKKEIMDEYIKKYGSCTPNGKVSDLIKILEENCKYKGKKGWSGYDWATAIRAGRSYADKLSTKESNTPLGRCYAYVKVALWCSNMVDHYLIGIAAKDAGSELENQGYTNLQSDPKTKLTDIKKAPVGAVIVYSGGEYGHIEVWTGTHFISDYKTSLARTETKEDKGVAPLTGRNRTCIGIWIK